jgi:two-component system, NtrC family, nitrogen regulation response regulator GlnG
MPFDLQTRLLRVLSDGQFYRVGGHAAVKAHVRVIAATHQDLEKRVKEGGFREDLFHRLNVIRLRLPALRERHEDVPMLTRHFLLQSARQLGVEPKRIADSALARLEQFAFPGNVRQLENICHWLTVMAPAQVISLQDLPPEVLEAPMYQLPVRAEQSAAAVSAATQTAPIVSVPAPELVGGIHPAASAPTTASVGASAATTMTGAAALAGAPSWSVPDAHATPGMVAVSTAHTWEQALEVEAQKLLAGGQPEVWDALTRRFESRLIRTALLATHGRRMEAAQRLGIGRNTITRKIQELGLDAPDEA